MNRKRASKIRSKIDAYAASVHPYDDPDNWPKNDFNRPPWTPEQINDFQKRINSAFGAENAFVLVWSGDRSYGDEICDGPWDSFGNPIGAFHRKPVLLFGEWKVNDDDFLYITCPRWVIMEVHHGSQLADWESAAWVSDENYIGGRKRIRPKRPPEFYYVHLKHQGGVITSHEQPLVTGGVPPCCQRMWEKGKRICYGKYREPGDQDIAMIRQMRERLDYLGIAQRNDTPRDAKTVMQANLSTKHYMQQAQFRRASAAKHFMLSNIDLLCGDIPKKRGSTMSKLELERIVTSALDQEEDERFSQEQL